MEKKFETKERDIFYLYYSPLRFGTILRYMDIKEERVLKYLQIYESLYNKIIKENK